VIFFIFFKLFLFFFLKQNLKMSRVRSLVWHVALLSVPRDNVMPHVSVTIIVLISI